VSRVNGELAAVHFLRKKFDIFEQWYPGTKKKVRKYEQWVEQ
jgi:hypothetical protein